MSKLEFIITVVVVLVAFFVFIGVIGTIYVTLVEGRHFIFWWLVSHIK